MTGARTVPAWVLAVALAVPAAGLGLLTADSDLDVSLEHHPAHFWIVVAAAGLNAALAYATSQEAQRRGDARVMMVSLAFLAAAGFLGLHALATPGVLLDQPNAGFAIATPIGLVIASGFAAASSLDAISLAVARRLRTALLAAMALWAVWSLAQLAPLDADAGVPERASGPLIGLAVAGIALYAVAVVRYLALVRRRRSSLLVVMVAAFVLLAEAMVAIAVARNWHATWWEWHVLMLAAFALIAWSAHRQWHEERFAPLYLDETAGAERDISVVFADLQGFTSFSEHHDPREVTEMLNAYFHEAIPRVVRRHGGEVDRIIGDALMVTFNRRGDQPDHAARAAAAALAIQETTARVAGEHPGWPRFRVGVNSGPAAVGVIGAEGGRTHTAIGDTVNLAARLEAQAPVGGVAIGPETARRLDGALLEPLGVLKVKGRDEPVEAQRLLALGAGDGG
ncbi:MAG TPA: adenylate/guanylate cyclase domain-containing protein [Capillimicrobium sp.]|nr:adenylate/guanylate cyclase domain-containing protein [Capillimicrobium sp.]